VQIGDHNRQDNVFNASAPAPAPAAADGAGTR
jgi:hypothetical protein